MAPACSGSHFTSISGIFTLFLGHMYVSFGHFRLSETSEPLSTLNMSALRTRNMAFQPPVRVRKRAIVRDKTHLPAALRAGPGEPEIARKQLFRGLGKCPRMASKVTFQQVPYKPVN